MENIIISYRLSVSFLLCIISILLFNSCATNGDIEDLQKQISHNRLKNNNLSKSLSDSDNKLAKLQNELSRQNKVIEQFKREAAAKHRYLTSDLQEAINQYTHEFNALHERYEPVFGKMKMFEILFEKTEIAPGVNIYKPKGAPETGIKIE